MTEEIKATTALELTKLALTAGGHSTEPSALLETYKMFYEALGKMDAAPR